MGAVIVSGTGKNKRTKVAQQEAFPTEMLSAVQKSTKGKVASWGLITSLQGRTRRRAYRVELTDGRLIKVRWLWNEARAQEIERYLRLMSRRSFPRVLARVDSTLILEWIRGNTLSSITATDQLYGRCGRLLANIHSTTVEINRSPSSQLKKLAVRIRSDAASLREWALLTPQQTATLVDRLHCYEPQDGRLSLIHGDFCGDNLVMDKRNEIYSIDNEALGLGFPEADLARALLRWGLTGSAEKAFISGYEEVRPLGDFPRLRLFWEMVSLVRSIKFRYRCKDGDHRPALCLLRQALSEPRK